MKYTCILEVKGYCVQGDVVELIEKPEAVLRDENSKMLKNKAGKMFIVGDLKSFELLKVPAASTGEP